QKGNDTYKNNDINQKSDKEKWQYQGNNSENERGQNLGNKNDKEKGQYQADNCDNQSGYRFFYDPRKKSKLKKNCDELSPIAFAGYELLSAVKKLQTSARIQFA
ncbi:MAG: hypothetical protein RSB59_07390, partial [Clostridia bacterium]